MKHIIIEGGDRLGKDTYQKALTKSSGLFFIFDL